MCWRFIGTDGTANVYAVGVAFFELSAIVMALFPPKKSPDTLHQSLLIFFGLCASWDFYKYLFLDPYGIYLFDYINTPINLFVSVVWAFRKKICF